MERSGLFLSEDEYEDEDEDEGEGGEPVFVSSGIPGSRGLSLFRRQWSIQASPRGGWRNSMAARMTSVRTVSSMIDSKGKAR